MKRSWIRPESDAKGLVEPSTAFFSRRRSLAKGALGLAAALALSGCAASETEAPQPMALLPDEDLDRLLDDTDPVVAGEPLDGPLLHRFYAHRGFEPVWTIREA